jgi:MFS family permease
VKPRYPFVTIVLAPVLGRLSDRYGRRPILRLSVLGSAFGYYLFGIAGNPPNLRKYELLVRYNALYTPESPSQYILTNSICACRPTTFSLSRICVVLVFMARCSDATGARRSV